MESEKVRAKDVLLALREQYGIEELTDLARASGIPRETLSGWAKRPETIVRSPGRKYLRQAIAQAPSPADLLAAIHEVNANVERLRVELFAIREQSESRAVQVVTGKRPHRGGGSL